MQIFSCLFLIAPTFAAVLGATEAGCRVNSGQSGKCISTGSCKGSGGKSEPGHCPGPADIQCCTYGSCQVNGVSGRCEQVSMCSGQKTPGFCPGPTDIQCCTTSNPGGGGHCGSPTVNDATVTLIKEFEGSTPTPYPDPDGHPTIGIGHLCQSKTCSEIKYPIPLTKATAAQLLNDDLKPKRDCITSNISNSVKLNPNQYGALVSWAFNVGCRQDSTLFRRLNRGEDPNTVAEQELPRWNRGDHGVLRGLTRRRAAEVTLFKTPAEGQAHPPVC